MNFNEVISYFSNTYANQSESFAKLEILAECLYQKTHLIPKDNKQKKNHRLALDIFTWLSENESTFSMPREQRIKELNKICNII